ncbi:41444_t:CDS:2, partial [Gigaspora margarita]
MILIISSTEHGTTAELTKRPNGSKFDATKISTENGSHNKTDQASVEAKNKNGEFSTSKSSGEQEGFVKGSSSEVHASKDKNGSKVDANNYGNHFDASKNSGGFNAQIQSSASSVSASKVQAGDNHGNHFDASKSSSVNGIQSQGHTSNVDASKGKGGSKYDANESSYELNAHRQNSLSSVSAKDSHGNQFDATNEIGRHNQASSSSVSASKDKSGNKFDASKSSSKIGSLSKSSQSGVSAKD